MIQTGLTLLFDQFLIMKKSQKHENTLSHHPQNKGSEQSSTETLKQNFSELVGLLTQFVQQKEHQKQSPKQKKQRPERKRKEYEVEPRNREVLLPLPESQEFELQQRELKQWLAEVVRTVFSSAFYYFQRAEMNFEQTKIFCSQNILKNIANLTQTHQLKPADFQVIDQHLVRKVLPYLGQRYPLTDSTEVNKKLSSMVDQIDNIENLENNYFSQSKIILEYRKDGNYYDLIMRVVNDLLNRLEGTGVGNSGKTNYQEFQKFMTQLFEKTYDAQWMNKPEDVQTDAVEETLKWMGIGLEQDEGEKTLQSGSSPGMKQEEEAQNNTNDKNKNQHKKDRQKNKEDKKQQRKKQQQKQKYKQTVKEYTSFLIGRKVPENVPLFGQQQISQNKITIKHPAILRMLTKWFEQLWKKYEKNYFSNRTQNIKLQKGQNVIDLKPQLRSAIDKLMWAEKDKISSWIKNIQKLNHKLESEILKFEESVQGDFQMDETERICGKLAFKVVKNLHKEIIQYLNKVIHGILTVSKRFHQNVLSGKLTEAQKSNWPFPPNLISFKVGDLMRCKLSSRQNQILKVYHQILALSRSKEHRHRFRIVRVKNRLKDSTNDILINARFNNSILCQIQLAIKSKASEFIKASNAFHHYIYELQRSQFGPLTQLCSIWMSFDGRAKIYEQLVLRQHKQPLRTSRANCNCEQYLGPVATDEPFICSECHHIFLHSNYILPHQKCHNCRDYFNCAPCTISKHHFQLLKNKLIIAPPIDKDTPLPYRKLLRDSCVKVINNRWAEFQNQKVRYGLSIFIESNRIKIKLFKLVFYNGKKYLIGRRDNDDLYQIGDISDQYFLRQFQDRNVLMQIDQHEGLLKIDDSDVIKDYVLPKMAKSNYRKYKDTVVLHMKPQEYHKHQLTVKDCSKILMVGSKAQRERVKNIFASDNCLTELPCKVQDFPNLQWLNLSRNPISSLKGLEKFSFLRILVMQNTSKQKSNLPNILNKLSELQFLQKLVLSHFKIGQIPSKFKKMSTLKTLELQHCQLTAIDNVCDCHHLQKLNVAHNNIVKLPLHVRKLQKLEIVIAHSNPLDIKLVQPCLPDKISKKEIPAIHLDLSECNLQQVPAKFSIFTRLEIFHLQRNNIEVLPPELFSKMVHLRCLDLSENKIREMPHLSHCAHLTKLDISYNRIEILPLFLSELPIEQFDFLKCPVKKIQCIHWLKDTLHDQSTILQKYSYWLQKIPTAQHISCSTKYSAQLLSQLKENQVSSSQDEEAEHKVRRANTFGGEWKKDRQFFDQAKSQGSENSDLQSEMSSIGHQKGGSQSSQQITHFFKGIKKRVSIYQDPEQISQSGSDGKLDEDQIQNPKEFQSSQLQFQQEDAKCAQKLTLQKICSHFKPQDLLVFDFQSKIKSSPETTFFQKQINLYHDENHPQVASKFCQLIQKQAIQNPTINIYAGRFKDNVSGFYQKKQKQKGDKSKVLYNDLRKDKIPFTYAVTISNFRKIEIRNTQIRGIPSQLLNQQLEKIVIYKAGSISQDIRFCQSLKWLKITKSRLRILPLCLGDLKHLLKLDLHQNNIEEIDRYLFTAMTQLKILKLHDNKLKQMPNIFHCHQLSELNISKNLLETIPSQMSQLPALKIFQFANCPIHTIQCRQWLCSTLDHEQTILHECQVNLLKTHVKNQLKHDRTFNITTIYKWNSSQEEYLPYDEGQENKYILFFNQNFKEQEIIDLVTQNQFLAFRFYFKTKYERQRITCCSQFKVLTDKKYPQTLQKFKKYLLKYKLNQTKMAVTQTEFVDLPQIKEQDRCFSCQQVLQYPFYWLKWEPPQPQQWMGWQQQPQFGCRNCVQAPDLLQHYKYLNNSILILKKLNYSKMPAENLGNNLQPQQIDTHSRHNFKCDGCGSSYFQLGEARYMCLGCKVSHSDQNAADLVNLCSKCVDRTVGKDKKLKKSLKLLGHKRWHPLLRILFNTEGYYLF